MREDPDFAERMKREAARQDDMRKYLEQTTVPAPAKTPWVLDGKDKRFLRSLRIAVDG